jgi:hypothetical protein
MLHDINGKVALETKIHESTKIEHDLPSGLYLVRVHANGINTHKKLIIE